jgi:hypothetical protein
VLPVPEYLPASQATQAATELPNEFGFAVPDGHNGHAPTLPGEYEPGAQSLQNVLRAGLNLPTPHAVQKAALAPLYEPAAQDTHAPLDALPTLSLNVPAGHAAHAAAPEPLYEPRSHCKQEDAPALLYDPPGQNAHAAAPLVAKRPAAQDVQAAEDVAPVAALNEPLPHAVQMEAEASL